uniref:Uncharacterized protein n=2 Tax=Prymnesium polylepis TaxID=72548 RepID=A0A6V4UF09_9EUKA|mmetsp:Transcript_12658/g.32101  ORF Transcript_12658/g.32101 Transcript_12658/m.32101 type:complete len:118 (+) Transcript_12658:220-573(+)
MKPWFRRAVSAVVSWQQLSTSAATVLLEDEGAAFDDRTALRMLRHMRKAVDVMRPLNVSAKGVSALPRRPRMLLPVSTTYQEFLVDEHGRSHSLYVNLRNGKTIPLGPHGGSGPYTP